MTKTKQSQDSDLDWKELEIMSVLLKKETHKREIIKEIKNRIPGLRNKPNSSLYLIFERLQKKGLITIRRIVGKGHKTFVSLTNLGLKQINKVLQWSFQLLAPSLIQSLLSNISAECQQFFSCAPSSKIAFIGPSLILNSESFLNMCDSCLYNSNQKRYILKGLHEGDVSLTNYESISCTFDDIPIKNGYFGNVLSFFTLSQLKDQKQRVLFLQELKRTLVSKGKIFLVELNQFRSFIYDSISSVTDPFNTLFSNNSKLHRFEVGELLSLLYKTLPKTSVSPSERAEFIFVKIQL